MTKEEIKAVKELTIGEAKRTFESEFGDYPEYDDNKVKGKELLDSYCDGVNDVLKILEQSFCRKTVETQESEGEK